MATTKKGVTETQISAWKNKYGKDLKIFETKDGKVAYFRKPNLEIILASEDAEPENFVKKNMFMMNNCFLGGDEEFTNDDEYRVALANAVATTFKIAVGSVKNV